MMDEKKWTEFAKEAVPELEKLLSLARKYGAGHLSMIIDTDGYVDCFVLEEDEKHYALTKLYDTDQYYEVKVNNITECRVPKEMQ